MKLPAMLIVLSALPQCVAAQDKPITLNEHAMAISECLLSEDSTACIDAANARRPRWSIMTAVDPFTDQKSALMSRSATVTHRGETAEASISILCTKGRLRTALTLPGKWHGKSYKVRMRVDAGKPFQSWFQTSQDNGRLFWNSSDLPLLIWRAGKLAIQAYDADGVEVTAVFDVSDLAEESAWLSESCPNYSLDTAVQPKN